MPVEIFVNIWMQFVATGAGAEERKITVHKEVTFLSV